MKLYYTVASQPEITQSKPSLSLGGFKSASPMPNSSFGNLFSDISMYTVKNANSNRYIALIAKNESETDMVNINVYFTYPFKCASKFRIAAVDLVEDTEGNNFMEHITDNSSKPLYAEFVEANGVDNKVNIGDLPAGGEIGLWIERELLLDTIKEQQNKIFEVTTNDPYLYQPIELPKEDNILFNIIWGS